MLAGDSVTALVLRDGEVDGRRADVVVVEGRIFRVRPDQRPDGPHDVLDVEGRAVLPGLHDHHLHLLAMAAAAGSLDLSPPVVVEEAVRRAADATPPGRWVRATGLVPSAFDLDRERLDEWAGAVPVRVQDASGALWVLNAAALAAVTAAGVALTEDERERGWILRGDERLGGAWPEPDLHLAEVGADLAAHGVTGVTDATPFTDPGGPARLSAAVGDGSIPQRVVITGTPGLAVEDDLPRGPAKVVIGDHDLPELPDLVSAIDRAHRDGRPVAVHCVTAEALALLLAAWAEVGTHPGDRVEHGAVVPVSAIGALADLGVTVVTQPGFVADRGDRYLAEVDGVDLPDLWRCGTLLEGGVPVGAGSDAPYGPADPWRAMTAAVDRATESGAVLGPDDRVAPRRALDLFMGPPDAPGGPPRRVEVGAPADLCVLDRPLADALDDLAAVHVTATLVGGRLVGPPDGRPARAGVGVPATVSGETRQGWGHGVGRSVVGRDAAVPPGPAILRELWSLCNQNERNVSEPAGSSVPAPVGCVYRNRSTQFRIVADGWATSTGRSGIRPPWLRRCRSSTGRRPVGTGDDRQEGSAPVVGRWPVLPVPHSRVGLPWVGHRGVV